MRVIIIIPKEWVVFFDRHLPIEEKKDLLWVLRELERSGREVKSGKTVQKLSQKEKEKILTRIFWDSYINMNELIEMLNTASQNVSDTRQVSVWRRLLNSCDWYTLIKLIPKEKMRVVLSDPILRGIYPKDLQKKYLYARKHLSKQNIPYSG